MLVGRDGALDYVGKASAVVEEEETTSLSLRRSTTLRRSRGVDVNKRTVTTHSSTSGIGDKI